MVGGRPVIDQHSDALLRVATAAGGAASGAAASAAGSWPMLFFGVPLAVFFAAFSGALVSLTFLQVESLRRAAVILFSGTLAGVYTSALVAEWWHFTAAAMGGCAFVIGGALQWAVPEFIERMRRK